MQSLSFQQNTGFNPAAMINRSHMPEDTSAEVIRDAVRAWAAQQGQDVVAGLIVTEWHQQGGEAIDFPDDISRARQKLFRFLDNRFDSENYRENVRLLTPAIMAVLPLEFRGRLATQDDLLSRVSTAMKECAEAKQAVLLGAPEHQKLKEVSEGIVSLMRLMPEQMGQLMAMVSTMTGFV